MSRIQRAQRSSGLSKLAAKAQKARTACGNSLAQAFHWFVHARALDNKLTTEQGADFVSLQLGALAADVRTWLSNRWLHTHCTTFEDIPAAVALGLTALLGATGAALYMPLSPERWLSSHAQHHMSGWASLADMTVLSVSSKL